MVTSFPVTLLAAALCGIASALGLGGGSLLVLWMIFLAGVSPEEARAVSLLFFFPAASVTFLRVLLKNRPLLRRLLPVIVSGCLAAAGTGFVSSCLETQQLRRFFGYYLVLTGIRQLFYRPR